MNDQGVKTAAELIILGSGSAIPVAYRRPAGYLIRFSDETLLFDLGPGSIHSAARYGAVSTISVIFLTHHHVDHCLDLGTLLFSLPLLKRHLGVDYRPRIVAHPEVIDFLNGWFGQNPFLAPDQIAWIALTPGKRWLTPGGAEVWAAQVNHISSSLAFRVVKDGLSFVYSGDTSWSDALCQLAEQADVLILECSHQHQTRSHLDPESARTLARLAGVRNLILSHFYPDMLKRAVQQRLMKAPEGFRIYLARDGLRLRFPSPSPVG